MATRRPSPSAATSDSSQKLRQTQANTSPPAPRASRREADDVEFEDVCLPALPSQLQDRRPASPTARLPGLGKCNKCLAAANGRNRRLK